MPNILQNTLKSNWRNYSPGGKRMKIKNIPFGGKINNNLRAMGTKKVGVLENNFAYMSDIINFAKSDTLNKSPFSRRVKLSELTQEEQNQLTPEQYLILYRKEKSNKDREVIEDLRQDSRQIRGTIRTGLGVSAEGRRWATSLGVLPKLQ